MDNNYQIIVGLEVHVELGTLSKMFCGCSADYFGKEPNTQTCPVCLGLPGALPVPNRKAIDWTIRLGLALGCTINEHSKFDRKNYFYPDLSKGYQISQFDEPLCENGSILIGTGEGEKVIRIRRVHIEEDTGKLQHDVIDNEKVTLVDFNRSGVPLMEVVTEPDFRSIEEVDEYVKKLQQIIRYLGISGADMEKGTMRLEPSISLKLINGESNKGRDIELPSYRVELKNINSFRFARKALEYEVKRQTEMLDKHETPTQQTRGWNELKNVTVAQRDKEEANDYRYFPEPDIPPLQISKEQLATIQLEVPELPDAKAFRFVSEFSLSKYDATLLTETIELANYFEQAVKEATECTPKELANWIINKKVDSTSMSVERLVAAIQASKGSALTNASAVEKVVSEILLANSEVVNQYKAGQKGVIGFLMSKLITEFPDVNKAQLMQKLQEGLQ